MSAARLAADLLNQRAARNPSPLGWPPAWRPAPSQHAPHIAAIHQRHVAWVLALPADHPYSAVWTPPPADEGAAA